MAEAAPAAPLPDAAGDATQKPEILRESRFVVEEGLPYRALRTASIWMNKLFFSSLILLAVWFVVGWATGATGCAQSVDAPEVIGPREQNADLGERAQCSVFLSPTSLYLGSMAMLSFVLSILFGVLGLMVGKSIVEATPAALEAGAGKGPDEPGR